MDLTKEYPRSPNERLLTLVSLARTIDKARAYNEGKLGEYHYDCPHDKPLFQFLGVDANTFAKKVGELGTDEEILEWVGRSLLSRATPRDIAAFNQDRIHWRPYPGSDGEKAFNELRQKVAPDRTDITTWFDLLDLDEQRPVPRRLKAA